MTETLCELGLVSTIAGVTTYCIFPEDALRGIPRVGGTKTPGVDAIRALRPDLVHMNLEENLEKHAQEIATFAEVFVSSPARVAEVDALLGDLGVMHGVEPEASRLRSRLQASLESLRERTRNFTFAVPIWKSPWMWCGGDTYVSDLVTAAGGVNVLAPFDRYPAVELERVLALEPDTIFLPDEPWLFTAADADRLRGQVPNVVGPFPGHLFTWHGKRTIDGLDFLADTLHR